MGLYPDTSQREHGFGNVDTATQKLNRLGFSLIDSFFPGEMYHVVPNKIQDDYPMMSDGRTPRFVAVVDSEGNLIYDKPHDNNPVLMRYQKILDGFLEQLTTLH